MFRVLASLLQTGYSGSTGHQLSSVSNLFELLHNVDSLQQLLAVAANLRSSRAAMLDVVHSDAWKKHSEFIKLSISQRAGQEAEQR